VAVSLELLRLGLTYICLLLLWCGATHGGKPEIHALEQVLWSYSYYGPTCYGRACKAEVHVGWRQPKPWP